jgi:hypothetical protein
LLDITIPKLIKFLFENLTDIYYKIDLFYTVVKTMAQQKSCQECNQKHRCQEIYQQLGKAQGPSVVFKAVVAFLLPISIFIASLAAFEKILAGTTDIKELRIALNFLLALLVTLAAVLIIKVINKHFNKNK